MGIFDFFIRKNNPLDWNDKGIETKKVDEVDILTYNDEPYTGIILSRYKNGKIQQLDNFFEGLREGNCEKYFSNGELNYVAEYKDGKNWGSTKFYNKSEKYLYCIYRG